MSSESHMGTDANGISFHMDWDSSNLYLAWDGTDLSSPSEGADIFFYLNTSEDGSVTAKSWNGIKTLPFAADYGVVVEDSSYARVVGYSSGQWQTFPLQICTLDGVITRSQRSQFHYLMSVIQPTWI